MRAGMIYQEREQVELATPLGKSRAGAMLKRSLRSQQGVRLRISESVLRHDYMKYSMSNNLLQVKLLGFLHLYTSLHSSNHRRSCLRTNSKGLRRRCTRVQFGSPPSSNLIPRSRGAHNESSAAIEHTSLAQQIDPWPAHRVWNCGLQNGFVSVRLCALLTSSLLMSRGKSR